MVRVNAGPPRMAGESCGNRDFRRGANQSGEPDPEREPLLPFGILARPACSIFVIYIIFVKSWRTIYATYIVDRLLKFLGIEYPVKYDSAII